MFKAEKHNKILFLAMYILLANAMVYILRPTYLLGLFMVYIFPVALTFSWTKRSRKKILIFAIFTTLIFAPAVELMARVANIWDVESILPRPFGLLPLENIFYAFVNFVWPLAFYEYFTDHDRTYKISKRLRYLIALYCAFAVTVFALFFSGNLFQVNYFGIAILVLIIPEAVLFHQKPQLLRKVLLVTLFFAMSFFVNEVVGLAVGHWWWPGEYLLPLNINGIIFPVDDAIIWYFLSTPALIVGYEFFADDWK